MCAEASGRSSTRGPYFPLDPDDKENRFQRAMHFFRRESDDDARARRLPRASATTRGTGARRRSTRGERIGGVRLLSLRIPIPTRRRVARALPAPTRSRTYPEGERKLFYHTPDRVRAERCGPDRIRGAATDVARARASRVARGAAARRCASRSCASSRRSRPRLHVGAPRARRRVDRRRRLPRARPRRRLAPAALRPGAARRASRGPSSR